MLYAIFNHTKQMRLLIRIGHKCLAIPLIGNFLSALFEYLVRIIFGSDISCKAKIPDDIIFVHGHDIVIGSTVSLGRGCKIFNGVTLGNRDVGTSKNEQPTIGTRCVISTGAKILGGVTIGDDCIIGANAVVLTNVPSNSVAVGVPARIIRKKNYVYPDC